MLRQFSCHNLGVLKPTLQVRLGQQLTLTQQLRQGIRLLQLSSQELKAEIREAFESNPMLDTEDNNTFESRLAEPGEARRVDHETCIGIKDDSLPSEPAISSPPDDIYEPFYTSIAGHPPASDRLDYLEVQNTIDCGSLQKHLLWQLELSSLSAQDLMIAATLVNALDESGYLHEPLESIHDNLSQTHDVELDEIEAVLKFVQRLDPVGCGTRCLQECLDVQLQQIPDSTPFLSQARSIVNKHLDLVAARDYEQLARQRKFSLEEVEHAISLIQSLHPKPGDLINSQKSEYIVPDVYVERSEGTWRVRLNSDVTPKLGINNVYSGMIKHLVNSDADYMRNQLQEARWFIKSVQHRNKTLLRVATSIVRHQKAFFEHGEEAMRPLVLKDIADQLDLHESTISRATTNKFLDSPRGIFEFKYFFSSHVRTNDGGTCSATAIKAMIKKLVSSESKAKPLSDNKIAALLEQEGVSIARRTIAKYREFLGIPPSNERRQSAKKC